MRGKKVDRKKALDTWSPFDMSRKGRIQEPLLLENKIDISGYKETLSGSEENDLLYGIDAINYGECINVVGWAFLKKGKRTGKVKLLLVNEKGDQYVFETETTQRYDLKYLYMSKHLRDAGFLSFISWKLTKGKYHIYVMLGDEMVNTTYDIVVNR